MFFFFNDPATPEIYTLSLHDALPISLGFAEDLRRWLKHEPVHARPTGIFTRGRKWVDRKSTRLNSSHRTISYAVFCLKKKKQAINARIFHKHTKSNTTANQNPQLQDQ